MSGITSSGSGSRLKTLRCSPAVLLSLHVFLNMEQEPRFNQFMISWQAAVDHKHYEVSKFTHPSDKVHYHVGAKYARLDVGGSALSWSRSRPASCMASGLRQGGQEKDFGQYL